MTTPSLLRPSPRSHAEVATFLPHALHSGATDCSVEHRPHTMRRAHCISWPSVSSSWHRSQGKRRPQQGKRSQR